MEASVGDAPAGVDADDEVHSVFGSDKVDSIKVVWTDTGVEDGVEEDYPLDLMGPL